MSNEYDLSDKQIAAEKELMSGINPISWGAFLIPEIWGPAHGQVITILFYPAWVFLDNLVYSATQQPSALRIVLSIIVCLAMLFVRLIYARLANAQAAHRAVAAGKSKASFIKSEKVWLVVGILIGLVVIVLASYYNLYIRPTVG